MNEVINNCITKVRLVKFRSFSFSIIGHGLLLVTIINIRPQLTSPEQKIVKLIQARLYKAPVAQIPTKELSKIQKPISIPAKERIKIDDAQKIKQKEKQSPNDLPSNNSSANELINKNKTMHFPEKTRAIFSASKALESLKSNIVQQNYKQSSQQHYQDYIKAKNAIPRSTTKFNEIPQAKAKTVNVNCKSTLNKGVMILSNLLGGSVKCSNFNGSQKFIDARLEKMGKRKNSTK